MPASPSGPGKPVFGRGIIFGTRASCASPPVFGRWLTFGWMSFETFIHSFLRPAHSRALWRSPWIRSNPPSFVTLSSVACCTSVPPTYNPHFHPNGSPPPYLWVLLYLLSALLIPPHVFLRTVPVVFSTQNESPCSHECSNPSTSNQTFIYFIHNDHRFHHTRTRWVHTTPQNTTTHHSRRTSTIIMIISHPPLLSTSAT
ncbi:hypothetical protein OF83DRAFT_582663 [Amylostereum chailletii]|nr:hypothetical protein OF83DRAFT_582663 [Amylostereum chailletii]